MLGETNLIAGCFRELKKANFTPPRLTSVRLYENGRLYRDRKLTLEDDNRLILEVKLGKSKSIRVLDQTSVCVLSILFF